MVKLENRNLPNHLIYDQILPKLPVKTLIRFKSISKAFQSTISNPNFTKSHLNFSSSSPKFILLCPINSTHKLILLHQDETHDLHGPFDTNFNLDLQFQHQRVPQLGQLKVKDLRFVYFVGSCNGLVCLYFTFLELHYRTDVQYGLFLICNPATHQSCEIINPSSEYYASDYWFAYVSSIDDYQIISLFTNGKNFDRQLYVFSVKTWRWKQICTRDDFGSMKVLFSKRTEVFNDILYWSTSCYVSGEYRVVGFDLVNEKLVEFQLMDWLNDYTNASFCIVKGYLSLVCSKWCRRGDDYKDVWILKRNNDWNSWEKLYSVYLSDAVFLDITPMGMFLVDNLYSKERHLKHFKIVDPTKDPLEQLSRNIYVPITLDVNGYVESLIWPLGKTKSIKEGKLKRQ